MSTLRCGELASSRTSKKFPVTSSGREESKRKKPVTQEIIATHLGRQLPCIATAHTHYEQALYDCVKHLVAKQAKCYSVTCPNWEVADMIQDCWHRIVKKLHTYKPPDRGGSKFTTWVVKVSNSVLNKGYRKGQKRQDRFVEMPDGLDENRVSEEDSTDDAERSDFMDTIIQLKEAHPEKADLIDAIFMDSDGHLNPSIVYKRAADTCGMKAPQVSRFFKEVVRPFFINRYEGE